MTKFMVQWEDHPSHLATRLGALLEHQKLVDVTLMCNTHTLRVHRAVLAAGSPYFEGILMRNLGQHPLIVLKDMQFSVLKSLIEFMYCGETSVTEENLPALLQAAKFFQVRGLSAMTKEALGLPAESGNSVNGAPNPSVSIGNHKSFVRPQKRVNIQSVKTTKPLAAAVAAATASAGGGEATAGAAYQTLAKAAVARSSQDTQAANAQLLLSLSEGKPKKAAGAAATGSPNLLKKAPPMNVQLQRSRPGFKSFKTEPTPAPAPAPPVNLKPTHSNILGNKKRPRPMKPNAEKAAPAPPPAPAPAPPPAAAPETTLYQDPETNIIYQIEAPAAAAEENVIYQLPDGTISDQHGNPLLDKDGNTQNILNYQLPDTQAGFELGDGQFVVSGGAESDMPILLDNGDGNYVTVHEDALEGIAAGGGFADGGVAYTTNEKGEYVVYKGSAVDKPAMSVEEALEEMMAEDKEEHADSGITVEAGGELELEAGMEPDSTMLEPSDHYLVDESGVQELGGQESGVQECAADGQTYLEEEKPADFLAGADTFVVAADADADAETYLAEAGGYQEPVETMGVSYLDADTGFVEGEPVEASAAASAEGGLPSLDADPEDEAVETNGVEVDSMPSSSSSSLLKNALTGGGVSSPGAGAAAEMRDKDSSIPLAVGLLPLQDALQKFQDMPEHTPRKTRSSDEPAVRSKRKASSTSDGGGESKRILLTEDWKISEDELSASEANG